MPREVYLIDGSRTPFLKSKGRGPFSAGDLAVAAARPLLLRQPFAPTAIHEVIVGSVMTDASEINVARVVALRLGLGAGMPGWTVQRNCGSGMQAIDCAMKQIQAGADLILAGGTESMSHAPVSFSPELVDWFFAVRRSKHIAQKLKHLLRFPFKSCAPVIELIRGLTDPIVNLGMGQTAENLAYRFGITRDAMDAYAMQSHQRLAAAIDNKTLQGVTPVYDTHGQVYEQDSGLRRDTTLDTLSRLPPAFEKWGSVSAGNSSQITDGAAMVLLASRDAVQQYQLPVLAKIIDVTWRALDPAIMGLGPVYAMNALLQQNHLQSADIDYWEINEAFAAQVLACLRAVQDADFCKTELRRAEVFGEIPQERLNVHGGAIALGHPVGASGARIVLELAHVLKEHQAHRGVASICIGGGQGGALLLENGDRH